MRRRKRDTFYVCSAIKDNELISTTVAAKSISAATDYFNTHFLCIPKTVLGPFYKKRNKFVKSNKSLKFIGGYKKAIYNNWLVNAFLLSEPVDHAYLVFIKRIDNKQMQTPTGTHSVPLSSLRFTNE